MPKKDAEMLPPLAPLGPAPVKEMQPNDDVLAYVDTSKVWQIYTIYACKLCAFDSLYEAETVDHLLKRHRPIPGAPFMAEAPAERFYAEPEPVQAAAPELPGGGAATEPAAAPAATASSDPAPTA